MFLSALLLSAARLGSAGAAVVRLSVLRPGRGQSLRRRPSSGVVRRVLVRRKPFGAGGFGSDATEVLPVASSQTLADQEALDQESPVGQNPVLTLLQKERKGQEERTGREWRKGRERKKKRK